MSGKTANVMARVEPQTKEKAEAILAQLGIPASVVINMLYKQIILNRGIPFSLSVPTEPQSRDMLDNASFDAMMEKGLFETENDLAAPAEEVFDTLRKELC